MLCVLCRLRDADGRWVTDPGKEYTEEEIMALKEGGLDLSPREAKPNPLAGRLPNTWPCSLRLSPQEGGRWSARGG